MIKYIKSNEREPISNIRNKFHNKKVLVTDLDLTDMNNITGCVYAISNETSDYDKLCKEKNNINKYKSSMLVGSYNNGGAIGVQYSIE